MFNAILDPGFSLAIICASLIIVCAFLPALLRKKNA